MLKRALHLFIFRLVRLFYSKIEVQGREHLPTSGAVVFVLNHPNGILDPALLMTALHRPIRFLSKSTLFSYPLIGWITKTSGALPIYRKADWKKRGGAKGAEDMTIRNEETFARCRALLHAGKAIALFPEGATHSEPHMLRFRTGAARIALSAASENNRTMNLTVVPIGLWYESKTRFRTSVLLVVGNPVHVSDYADQYRTDSYTAVRQMTDFLEERLGDVVLQAENRPLLKSIPAVAAWTTPKDKIHDLQYQHTWSASLLKAYKNLQQSDPNRLERIAEYAWHYAYLLQSLGVADPWQLESPSIRPGHLLRKGLLLLLLTIPALAGAVLSYLPHKLSGRLARKIKRKDRTQSGTIKLLGGMVLQITAWAMVASFVGIFFGFTWAVCLFCVAPFCAYAAVRWKETWTTLRELFSVRWLRERRGVLVANLTARRKTLTHHIMEAVASVQKNTPG